MKRWIFKCCALSASLYAGGAVAAISCSLSATSVNVIYTGAVNNSGGTISLTCTRLATDPTTQNYWVGITPRSNTNRPLYRHGAGTAAADRLNTSIYKNNTTTNWNDNGNSRVSGSLNFGAALSRTVTLDYDFRIPAGQAGKNAGIYDSIFTVGLQLTNNGGVIATTQLVPTANVPTQCFVGQVPSGNTAPGAISPSAISLVYTSFAPAAQTANMSFTVDCTLNTTYQLDLTPANGTLLGLNYTVRFSNGLASWAGRLGSGLAQPYTITATVPPNQAGTCATASCLATQPTTITITY